MSTLVVVCVVLSLSAAVSVSRSDKPSLTVSSNGAGFSSPSVSRRTLDVRLVLNPGLSDTLGADLTNAARAFRVLRLVSLSKTSKLLWEIRCKIPFSEFLLGTSTFVFDFSTDAELL